jgi:DNA-binding CsgD family transcriptional regulator
VNNIHLHQHSQEDTMSLASTFDAPSIPRLTARAFDPLTPVTTPPSNVVPRLHAVLDQLDTGVLLCDGQARLLLANAAARQVLLRGDVLKLAEGGVLREADAESSGALGLRRAVHNAVQAGRRQLLPLRAGGHSLMVAVQPLVDDDSGVTHALLLLGRRQLAPALVVELLGGVYALTLAERRVLSGLLAGERIDALARLHGVAISTVRTQVAALRGKFGVKRVDDLMRLVAELPPMVSALRASGCQIA